MKTNILLLGLLIEFTFCAQSPKIKAVHTETTMENHGADEKQIIQVTDELTRLMIARDTAAMNRIVDKGFTLTHMTGYVQSKAEWFAEIDRESMKYYSAKKVAHSLDIQGGRATFTQQNEVDARIWGSRHTWRLQQIYQLEKRQGQWIILNSVASTF